MEDCPVPKNEKYLSLLAEAERTFVECREKLITGGLRRWSYGRTINKLVRVKQRLEIDPSDLGNPRPSGIDLERGEYLLAEVNHLLAIYRLPNPS